MQNEPWYAEFQRDLARTTRRDETALHARISELEQECERLRRRIAALEKAQPADDENASMRHLWRRGPKWDAPT